MSKGWISLYRKTLDNPILKTSKKFSTFEAWIWLLLNANHKERKVVMGSSIYKVKKGAMITSMRKLCKKFGWGNSRLRTFLLLLQKDEMIVVKTNHSLTQITLLNYELLQKNKPQTNQKQDTNKSLPNTNNNDNNVNKEIRENIFNTKVKEIFDEKHPSIDMSVLESFCNYWTESNMNGKKMKFEMQRTFDISRRLSTWINNSKDWNVKATINLSDFKLDATGYNYIGYCAKCNVSDFYKEYELKSDSRCCNDKIKPTKEKKND